MRGLCFRNVPGDFYEVRTPEFKALRQIRVQRLVNQLDPASIVREPAFV